MRTRLTTEVVGTIKTAAKKSSGTRDLEGAPTYDKDKVVHIVNMLTMSSSSMDTAKKVLEELTSVPNDAISPDGMLGGRGYVMPVRDIKEELSQVITSLSSIRDTLADELNNPGWGLSKDEKDSILKVREELDAKTQDNVEDISSEIEQIFGSDEEDGDIAEISEDVPEEEGTEEGEEDDDEDSLFPSFKEKEDIKEATLKKASSSNMPFVGISNKADEVTIKLASSVLTGLVKSCTAGTVRRR